MSYRKGVFKKKQGTRVRAVPEMGMCLVFTPQNPNLYTLNATSWLILELCDGASMADLRRAYWKEVNLAYDEQVNAGSMFVAPPRPVKRDVHDELLEGIQDLQQRQVIEFIPALNL